MNITRIKSYLVSLENDQYFLVAIETDKGFCGWGEATGSRDNYAVANMIHSIEEELKGKDAHDIVGCTEKYRRFSYPINKNNRVFSTVWSAIDQALWDVKAQDLGVPLFSLLGAKKKKLKMYANINRYLRCNNLRTAQDHSRVAQMAFDQGFQVIKCAPFDEVTPLCSMESLGMGLRRLEAVVKALGDIKFVAIDFHQRFNPGLFRQVISLIKKEFGNPYWIEDPIDFNNYKSSKCEDFIIAGGESAIGYNQALQFINSGKVSIFMPDVKYVGGVSVVRNLIPVCEEAGVMVSLHNPNGPISCAHSAHLMATADRPQLLEYPFLSIVDRAEYFNPRENIVNGYYLMNDEPGIGIHPTDLFISKYGKTFSGGVWK